MAFRQAWPTPPVSTRKFLPDISDLPGDFRWYATLAATRLNTNFVCSVTRVKDGLSRPKSNGPAPESGDFMDTALSSLTIWSIARPHGVFLRAARIAQL